MQTFECTVHHEFACGILFFFSPGPCGILLLISSIRQPQSKTYGSVQLQQLDAYDSPDLALPMAKKSVSVLSEYIFR